MLDENKDHIESENQAESTENKVQEQIGDAAVQADLKSEAQEEAVTDMQKATGSSSPDDDQDTDDVHDEDTDDGDTDDAHNEDIDDDDDQEEETEHELDYSKVSLEELVKELHFIIKNESVYKAKNKVDRIRYAFNQKFNELLKKQKESFLAEGGNIIDFHYTNPQKAAFNDLLFEYKTKRELYYKKLEEEQRDNLARRLELIEELKQLIDNAEPATMYGQFKELQEKWRAIGKIPRSKYNDTWRTYQHHVERFYDLLHLSNDFRDLDFKHNLEEKLKLVERAEELVKSDDLQYSFKELQALHKMWKEDIGPVAREHREAVWERFSEATKKIHERRHELIKQLESKYEENAEKKREVIAKINNLLSGGKEITSHKLWQQKIKELEKLRQEFFGMGLVPKNLNEKIWKEFKEATHNFNTQKNTFYKQIKKEQLLNLEKKNALIEKAEQYKDSENWEEATEVMKQVQAEWKNIGHVPRKYSDKIWKRFKDACNHYFDRLHELQDEENKDQIEQFNKKKELLANLKSQADSENKLTLKVINEYVDSWHKLGRLSNGMGHIEAKFNKLVNSLYSKLDMDAKDLAMLKFRTIVDGYLSSGNYRKLDNEQLFVRKKVDELTREIQQLENNISFISNADDDNPILKNVHQSIDNYNEQLSIWKAKLDYLTSIEY
ncbi:MAG: DUF349 domain-containing protein [Flavobacteriaceae bacterium]|nr:DUF349 domain-containing protein [Flavobacteriaceae bacterium]